MLQPPGSIQLGDVLDRCQDRALHAQKVGPPHESVRRLGGPRRVCRDRGRVQQREVERRHRHHEEVQDRCDGNAYSRALRGYARPRNREGTASAREVDEEECETAEYFLISLAGEDEEKERRGRT